MLEPAFAVVTAAFAEGKAMIARQRVWDPMLADPPRLFMPQGNAPAQSRAMLSRAVAV